MATKRRRRTTGTKATAAAQRILTGKATMSASQIHRLLEAKYEKYFCTAEIAAAGRHGPKTSRIDFVAVRPSWSNPEIHAMEVKVSRADFIGDDKWPRYLDSCQQFWFVTAPGVATKGEIPEQAGWIEASANGARLFVRKKAPLREMSDAHQATLFRQILHRDFYGRHRDHDTPEAKRKYWESWIAEKAENKKLAYRVNAEQRRLFEDLQRRTIAAEREMERMQWVTDFLGERGVKPGHVARLYNKDGAKEMLRHFAPDLFDTSGEEMKALQRTARHLEDAVKDFRRRIDEGTNAVTAALSAEADDA